MIVSSPAPSMPALGSQEKVRNVKDFYVKTSMKISRYISVYYKAQYYKVFVEGGKKITKRKSCLDYNKKSGRGRKY